MPEKKPNKILIVEDAPESIQLLKLHLKDENYDLYTANDGDQALEKTKEINPDLILLDIMLPKQDGFKVCEKLKTDPETMFIPIIMITAAYKDVESRVKGIELGADEYLTKPYEKVELLARIHSLLRIKKYHDALQKKRRELEAKNQTLMEIDRLKDELAGLIVHDMKNPLFVIQGNLQMMSMGVDSEQSKLIKKYIDRIDRSANNLLKMMSNLLDISKIEDGAMRLNSELANINELVQKCIKQTYDNPEFNNRLIEADLTPAIVPFYFDTSILERAIESLITFALNNTDIEETIYISTNISDNELFFTIKNRGAKIPPEFKDKLFEKFFQKRIKSEGFIIGRGLALPFCKMAIEAHGGKIWLEDSEQNTNIITFSLPLKKSS
jgi:signal transduction histidine kinase